MFVVDSDLRDKDNFNDLRARVRVLERRSKRWWLLSIALSIVAIILIAIMIVSQRSAVTTNRIVLRDSTGQLRGELKFDQEKGVIGLGFYDNVGQLQMLLGMDPQRSGLTIGDPNSTERIFLTTSPEGSSLKLSDAQGRIRFLIEQRENLTVLKVQDSSGKIVWQAP